MSTPNGTMIFCIRVYNIRSTYLLLFLYFVYFLIFQLLVLEIYCLVLFYQLEGDKVFLNVFLININTKLLLLKHNSDPLEYVTDRVSS